MSVWPVFVLAEMHQDEGVPFSVGDRVTWPVLLKDGRGTGCPRCELKTVEARLVADGDPSVREGCLAVTSELSAWWLGPGPAGSVLTLPAYLDVDIWRSPPTVLSGSAARIRTVSSRSQVDGRGVWMPSGPWRLTDVETATTSFAGSYADPGAPREIGVLVDLDVARVNGE